jgi:hypothetical protein
MVSSKDGHESGLALRFPVSIQSYLGKMPRIAWDPLLFLRYFDIMTSITYPSPTGVSCSLRPQRGQCYK